MKVYVLTVGQYDNESIVGVFSSKESAENVIQNQLSDPENEWLARTERDFDIYEFELDE